MSAPALRARPHVIFDFGAVLFRWEPVALFQALLPQRAPDEAAARALAERVFKGYTGAWGRFDAGTIERDELVPVLAEQSGLSPAEIDVIIDGIPPHLQPLPDSVALLEDLAAAGHRLFYLSNMPAAYADHLERHQPVLQRFEDGLFSARVKRAKPEREIFALALQRFGVEAADCVFLDDHPANVEAARALGIEALRFTDARQARLDLRGLGLLQDASLPR